MSFGGAKVPPDCVVRTFRVKVMTTAAKERTAREMLRAGGDVLAWTIDRFHSRRRVGLPPANGVADIWPDLRDHGSFGDLSMHAAQDVTKTWSANYLEVLKRRKNGEKASLPLRKHYLVPVTWSKGVTWRKGEFSLRPSSRDASGCHRARDHPSDRDDRRRQGSPRVGQGDACRGVPPSRGPEAPRRAPLPSPAARKGLPGQAPPGGLETLEEGRSAQARCRGPVTQAGEARCEHRCSPCHRVRVGSGSEPGRDGRSQGDRAKGLGGGPEPKDRPLAPGRDPQRRPLPHGRARHLLPRRRRTRHKLGLSVLRLSCAEGR